MSSTTTVDDGLARLLAEQVRTAATGIFSATSGKLKRLFCLREGRIIFVASNMIEEQFEEVDAIEGNLDTLLARSLMEHVTRHVTRNTQQAEHKWYKHTSP